VEAEEELVEMEGDGVLAGCKIAIEQAKRAKGRAA